MLKQYVEYIKDNPKGYWFKAKWFGWGWTPVKWQGWLVIAIYVALIALISSTIDETTISESEMVTRMLAPFIILTVILFAICMWKGEKPRWNWGMPKKKK